MTEENSTPQAPGMGKLATALIWLISLSVIVGAPLLGWLYFESTSTEASYSDCEVEDAYPLTIKGFRYSETKLMLKTSCGRFGIEPYEGQIYPGDIVDLKAKYYQGGSSDIVVVKRIPVPVE